MYIIDLLPKLGITEEMIERTIGDLALSISNGYEIRTKDIRTGAAIQMIDIHPNVYWTDGTCRPK